MIAGTVGSQLRRIVTPPGRTGPWPAAADLPDAPAGPRVPSDAEPFQPPLRPLGRNETFVDEAGLLDRCRRGDGLAWETLVRSYQSSVIAVTRHYLRDIEEARDVAQDVFVRLYENLESFSGGDGFRPWLLRMARNASIDRIRRIQARPPVDDIPAADAELPSRGDPEESAGRAARENLLRRAVARLAEAHREVVLLKEIQGLTLDEVAEILRLPVGTVKSRSNRARLELAQIIRAMDPSFGERAS